jgi:hypothetical protein
MKEASKKVPPSRARYDEAHPTVSCRVSKDLYDELETISKKEGKSLADILKIGLGRLEEKAADCENARNEGIYEGYMVGFSEAKKAFKVMYPCIVCGEMITVSTVEEKEAIMQYMVEHNWGHHSCHKGH